MTEVKTTAGTVSGKTVGGVTAWLGVPFAAPPVGALRFRPPVPHPGWTGVRVATELGPAAAQPASPLAMGLGATSEDCLLLNVWSPAADAAGRPVLVWIHGGAYMSGSGGLYDGAGLASLGDVVVVTINYRLGVFGFVDVASVAAGDAASNLGLRDQVAALEWVRDNIAAFGGDPAKVTVAGESAGSVSASLLLAAPSTRGLFRAAILESGTYSLIHGSRVEKENAEKYARELGLVGASVDRWRALPAEQLVAAQKAVQKAARGTVAAAPWFDGDVVAGSLEEVRQAPHAAVALLAGHNHDEITLFQLPTGEGPILPTTRKAVVDRLPTAYSRDEAMAILRQYPDTRRGNIALTTHFTFAMPTRHLAERHVTAGNPVFFYRFDAAVPFLGATHASELAYLWEMKGIAGAALRGRWTAPRRALATRLQQHWVSFVADLDPGPSWPSFTLPERATKVFDPEGDRMQDDPDGVQRATWLGRDVLTRS